MGVAKKTIYDELNEFRVKYHVWQKVPCSAEENHFYAEQLKAGESLPEGVYQYIDGPEEFDEFYTLYQPDLTHEELMEYLEYQKLEKLDRIKVYVAIPVIVSAIAAAVWLLSMLLGAFVR